MADQWNSQLYESHHRFVSDLARDLVSLADAKPGMRILDVGCGTGHLTAELAKTGAHVIGIDRSQAMIESARHLYAHSDNPIDTRQSPSDNERLTKGRLEFLVDDIVQPAVQGPFEVVFSNATFHWIEQIETAVSHIARLTRPGGRLVTEFGGKGNIKLIMQALDESLVELGLPKRTRHMYFPSIAEFARILESANLEVVQASLFDRLTPLEGEAGMLSWLNMFASIKVDYLDDGTRRKVFERTVNKLQPTLWRDGIWYADYRRIRVVAVKVPS